LRQETPDPGAFCRNFNVVRRAGRSGRSSATGYRPQVRRSVLGLLAAVVLAGCEVRTEVNVHLEEDGSGTVEVAVGLDQEALAELPDLDQSGVGDPADLTHMVRTEDLQATGWEVSSPETDDDGFTWVRATKPFGTPEEAVQVLSELTGPQGQLRDWEVERQRSFGRTRFRVAGTVDLSGGLEAFGDAGLASALDGEPLGEDVSVIEQRFGQPLSELMTLDVTVIVPGASRTWSPALGEEATPIAAESTEYDWPVLLLVALAAACFVGLVALLVVRAVRGRRPAQE
jgi:hypothetical protein